MDNSLSVDAIRPKFEAKRNEDNASHMARYMRGKFAYFGIKAPLVKQLTSELLKTHGTPSKERLLPLVQSLWDQPERELQYLACTLLTKNLRQLDLDDLPFLISIANQKPWWDSIDTLAPRIIGPILLRHKESHRDFGDIWINDPSFWIQRIALLYQLKWKAALDWDYLSKQIQKRSDDKEFFIRKAIGWILREYSKTNEAAIREFVANTPLSPLSKREALKWLDRIN